MIDGAMEIAAAFLLRSSQMLALCAPTLLCGMLVAGVARCWIGGARVRAWFGTPGAASLLRAAILALFLPVCAIGVWPVIVTLRRLGASVGPLVVLALASGIATPWTIGYLLDRAGFTTGALLVLTVPVIAIACGALAGRLARRESEPTASDVETGSDLRSLAIAAGRSMDRTAWAVVTLAAVGAGLLGAAIPPNMIGEWLVERGASHAALIAGASLLHYAAPATVAMHAGEVVSASTMPGLLVPLVGVGSAINLGVIIVGAAALGVRRAAVVVLALVMLTGAAAFAFDRALYDPEYQPTDSHAFEDLGRPFQLLKHPDGAAAWFAVRFAKPLQDHHALAAVGVLALVAVARMRPREMPARYASRAALAVTASLWVAGTGALSVYTYYPSPKLLVDELRLVAAELNDATLGGREAEQRRAVATLDRRLGQLPISLRLYGRPFPAAARNQRDSLLIAIHQARSSGDAASVFAGVVALDRSLRDNGSTGDRDR